VIIADAQTSADARFPHSRQAPGQMQLCKIHVSHIVHQVLLAFVRKSEPEQTLRDQKNVMLAASTHNHRRRYPKISQKNFF